MTSAVAQSIKDYLGIMDRSLRLTYIPIMRGWIGEDAQIIVNGEEAVYDVPAALEALVWLVQVFEAWKEGME